MAWAWFWRGGHKWGWGWRKLWPGNGPWSFLPPFLRPGWWLGRGYCRYLYGPGAGWWLARSMARRYYPFWLFWRNPPLFYEPPWLPAYWDYYWL